jgi:hypothetical protein
MIRSRTHYTHRTANSLQTLLSTQQNTPIDSLTNATTISLRFLYCWFTKLVQRWAVCWLRTLGITRLGCTSSCKKIARTVRSTPTRLPPVRPCSTSWKRRQDVTNTSGSNTLLGNKKVSTREAAQQLGLPYDGFASLLACDLFRSWRARLDWEGKAG